MNAKLPDLKHYATIVFDCDGVVLDSNRIKSEAFRVVAMEAGEEAADALVAHHRKHGGVSRNEKFRYFVEGILGQPATDESIERLVARYAEQVREALFTCPEAPGLRALRAMTPHARWAIVSGGAQEELRNVFAARGLAPLFDSGIHGSPATKDALFARLVAGGAMTRPAIYLGDSRYDHEAAVRAGLDFVFISGWTEFEGWREYCASHALPAAPDLTAFLGSSTGWANRSE